MTEILKSYIRDINLNVLTGGYNVKYDTSKSRSEYQFLKLNWKLIKYVTKIGGVLTGSRALKCCSINGTKMLDRRPNDFDFLITKEMAFQICDHFKFRYNLTDRIISIKKEIWTSYDHYGDNNTRYGAVDVHLIIVDELPEFIEQNNIRITSFTYVINEKLKMIEDSSTKDEKQKHADDLFALTMRFNLIADE